MMKNDKRRVPSDSFQHIFKITADSGVLFYRTVDHLVYYTIESVMCRRYKVPVVVGCHMFTHTHKVAVPLDPAQMAACESNINIAFTREYNKEVGRTGRLFKRPYGSAPKRSDRDKRSVMIYVLNNPVEKKLCTSAIQDRWTFLAYFEREYPFSERPVLRRCRWALRNAMTEVEMEFKCGRYLKYAMLHRLFAGLNPTEREQLTDYIIQLYFYFDRDACYQLFGSLEKMIQATDYSVGKEFDVGEVFESFSDTPFREMCQIVAKYRLLEPGLPLLHLPVNRLRSLALYLRQHTTATETLVARFLHYQLGA